MKALIDSDILLYRIGFTTEGEEEGIARWRMDELISGIQDSLETEDIQHFLSTDDHSNFRYELFPEYKANRIGKPKPQHYNFLKQYITDKGAIIVSGQEADDALGIAQTGETCICSIDKDLDQIPGWHFNFVTGRKYKVSPIESVRSFYDQVLVGDASDNIQGCPKIGKVKSNKILEGCQHENEMLKAVIECYQKAYPKEEWADRLLLAGRLLWIRKKPEQEWELSSGEVVSKILLESFLSPKGSSSPMSHVAMPLSSLSSNDITPQILS
jgi:5'-3' exonuclease